MNQPVSSQMILSIASIIVTSSISSFLPGLSVNLISQVYYLNEWLLLQLHGVLCDGIAEMMAY